MISVLIATRERPKALLACLASLASNQYTQYEVIIIDQSKAVDASVKQYIKKHHRMNLYHLPGRGKGRALQQGLAKMKGEIVAFTDDDCIVAKNWLAILQEGFAKNQCDGLFGQVLPYQPARHVGMICPCTVHFKKKEFVRRLRYHTDIGYGNNMAFRKQTLDEIGPPKFWLGPGSVGSNAEDAELTLRALLSKKIILRHPKSIVYHNRWLTTEEMNKQKLSYAQGEAASYGYLALRGTAFSRKILARGIKAHLYNLKRDLRAILNWSKSKNTFSKIYWDCRLLLASARGLGVGFWFFLTEPLRQID